VPANHLDSRVIAAMRFVKTENLDGVSEKNNTLGAMNKPMYACHWRRVLEIMAYRLAERRTATLP
jgi:hypothetical protein